MNNTNYPKKWEYKVGVFRPQTSQPFEELEELLNKFGQQGWELANMEFKITECSSIILKRAITEAKQDDSYEPFLTVDKISNNKILMYPVCIGCKHKQKCEQEHRCVAIDELKKSLNETD